MISNKYLAEIQHIFLRQSQNHVFIFIDKIFTKIMVKSLQRKR